MKLPPVLCLVAVLALAPAIALGAPGAGNGKAKGQDQGHGPPPSPAAHAGKDNPPAPPGHEGHTPPGHQDDSAPAPPGDAVLSPEGLATVGADQNIALDAVRAGLALPLDDLLAAARSHWGGRVIDAKLLKSRHGLLYRLTVLTDAGVARRIFLDARTGRQLIAP